MTALLLLAGAALAGAWVVRRVLPRVLDGVEQALWGLVAGWMLATLAAYALARTLGRLSGAAMLALAIVVAAVAVALWLPAVRRLRLRRVSARDMRGLWRARHAGLLVVLALFAPVYAYLYATRMLRPGADGALYSGGSTWYDIGLHLAISTSFAHGENFPPVYTPFPPEPLLYPFMPDFLTAALVASGLSLRVALLCTAVPLALALTGIAYSFALRAVHDDDEEHAALTPAQAPDTEADSATTTGAVEATTDATDTAHAAADATTDANDAPRVANDATHASVGRRLSDSSVCVSAALATALFLLNGGLGFLYFFRDWQRSGLGLAQFFGALVINYANMPERQIYWTNLVADTLLPQRTSLFGLPVALMIFTAFAIVWRGWSHRVGAGVGVRRGGSVVDDDAGADVSAAGVGADVGVDDGAGAGGRWAGWRVLFVAGVLAGLLPLFHAHSFGAVGFVSGLLFLLRPRRAWLAFWAPSVALALPQFAGLAGHLAGSGFMRLQPGWRYDGGSAWGFLIFWLMNVGVFAVLVVPAWLAAPRVWRRFHLAFAGLLAFGLVVVVSPNDYDNIKLMYYWYAHACALVARWLVRLAARPRVVFRVLAAVLALACVASGLLALRHESANVKLLYSAEEVEAARFVREHTPPRSLFLSAPTVHQPVLSLAGRAVMRGDTAWLWSHGYDFPAREADVRAIYAGRDDAATLLKHYRIDFVYLGRRERELFRAQEDFFKTNLPVFYRRGDISIYDARPLTRPPADDAAMRAAGTRTPESEDVRRATASMLAPPPPREFAERLERDPAQLLIEFPRAAFSVYRYYKVARGRWPEYREFMQDMRAVGSGVYVGADGWERRLEANKLTLTDAWPARDEFRRAFDGLGPAEFVAALYRNAGVEPSPAQHKRLAAALEAGAETRASVLRHVAEERELFTREYDAAYVLTHYFGYLRRGPADPPDKDLEGFNFWLRILQRTHDYRSVTRVFIESGEYKDQGKGQK